MNAERLFVHYKEISEAPDAIARLRRFILDMAVRGKLVPQDPMDEPAWVRFAHRTIAEIVQKPFELPPSWTWVRVGDVAEARLGKMLDRAKNKGTPRRYLRNVNVRWFDFDLTDLFEMPFEDLELSEFALRTGDVLVCEGGEPGRAAVWDEPERDIYFQKAIHRLRFSAAVDSHYFVKALKASADDGRLAKHFTGVGIKHLTGKGLDGYVFPLPPIAEQHRIVAKVNEIMALCDRLEAARAEREVTQNRLTVASLARLNAPDLDTLRDDACFTLNVLDVLTVRPHQVRQLRQTILDLGVRGKLVAQHSDDESGLELLKRIHRSRRARRTRAQGKANEHAKPLPEIPANWTWTVIDAVAADDDNAITDGPFGAQLKTDHYVKVPGYRVIRLQNVGPGFFREEHRSYIDDARFERLSKHHVAPGDLVVAGLVDPLIRCCQVPPDIGAALVKADCYRFSVHPFVVSRFAMFYLNSRLAQDFAEAHHHGMTLTRIGLGNFRRIPFPLPPSAEQYRIIEKVDELMALCDRLETHLNAAATTRRRLLDALLAEALTLVEKQMV